jgi:uncharacterized membrane protein (Fun14 family)
MTLPPELSWIIPVLVPFIVGILAGAIVKKAANLLLLGIGLIVILSATGYISVSFEGIFERAMEFLPNLINTGQGFMDVLPYTSVAFLLGLAIGLWKG